MRILEKLDKVLSENFCERVFDYNVKERIANNKEINFIIKGDEENRLKLYVETETEKIRIKSKSLLSSMSYTDFYNLSILAHIIIKEIKSQNQDCKYEIIFDSKNKEILKEKFEQYEKENMEDLLSKKIGRNKI